jgi:peptidoglycan/xylan/chitin deacetylase (PgdA/CDA1 family)
VPVLLLSACTTMNDAALTAPSRLAPGIEYYNGMVRRVPSATGCVALTFDDGPSATWTPRLLNILAEENVRATFFLVGTYAAQRPDIVAAISAAGHEIGNHSWSHPVLPRLSSDAVRRQIDQTDAVIRAATGHRPDLIRLPYGSNSPRVMALMDRPVIFWNVDGGDWSHHSSSQIVTEVVAHARSGSIVGLHDTHGRTIAAVRQIIRSLRARGYELVTLSRLMTGLPCR